VEDLFCYLILEGQGRRERGNFALAEFTKIEIYGRVSRFGREW